MKYNFLKVAFIAAFCMMSFTVRSDGGSGDGGSGDNNTTPPKQTDGRPKVPAYRNVVCDVENGFLSIRFRDPEGHASVEIKDLTTGLSLSFEFESAAGFRYALPPMPSQYQVTVRTELNNIFKFNF